MHEWQFNTVISFDGTLMPDSGSAEKLYWWDVFKQLSHPQHIQTSRLSQIINI